jgi:predicted dithiol-disulfide oxidoreductase (DUF899 family)
MTESKLILPGIVSRDEWLVARKQLLAKEKELTRARDALSAERRRLPMVNLQSAIAPGGAKCCFRTRTP